MVGDEAETRKTSQSSWVAYQNSRAKRKAKKNSSKVRNNNNVTENQKAWQQFEAING